MNLYIMGISLENNISNKKVHYIAIGDESVVSIFEKDKDLEVNTINNYEKKRNL